ncbi:MAG: DUF29 domain-containing protein, partial [Microcystis panniformis]
MTAQIPISKISLYDRDFQLWIETTVNQLRQEDFDSVDWTNLIEELASMGKNNRHALKSLLIQLLAHLLNLVYWQTEREYNANKWEAAIINFRVQIADLLEDSPSLKPYLLEIFDSCYGKARQIASKLSK